MPAFPRERVRPVAPEHIHVPFTSERPETAGSGHRHWGITAFTKWDGETLVDSVSVEVEASNEQDAWVRAMEIIERPFYRTSWVREFCSKDDAMKAGA